MPPPHFQTVSQRTGEVGRDTVGGAGQPRTAREHPASAAKPSPGRRTSPGAPGLGLCPSTPQGSSGRTPYLSSLFPGDPGVRPRSGASSAAGRGAGEAQGARSKEREAPAGLGCREAAPASSCRGPVPGRGARAGAARAQAPPPHSSTPPPSLPPAALHPPPARRGSRPSPSRTALSPPLPRPAPPSRPRAPLCLPRPLRIPSRTRASPR